MQPRSLRQPGLWHGLLPQYGGDFCTWQSEVRKITSEKAGTKHGIRGLNVNLRWKEIGIKESSDFVEVELRACGNKDMTHHCTDWSRAHYHEDDLNPQPGRTCVRTFVWGRYTYCAQWGENQANHMSGWSWVNDQDENHLEINEEQTDASGRKAPLHQLYYQVRIRLDANYDGWNRLTDGYALDRLDVKVEDCEPENDSPPNSIFCDDMVDNGDFTYGMSHWDEYAHFRKINGAHTHRFHGESTGHLHGYCHYGTNGGIKQEINNLEVGVTYELTYRIWSGAWDGHDTDNAHIKIAGEHWVASPTHENEIQDGPDAYLFEKRTFTATKNTESLIIWSGGRQCIDIDKIKITDARCSNEYD